MYGALTIYEDKPDEWTKIAEMSFPLGDGCTVTAAELEACLWAVTYLVALLHGREALSNHLKSWQPLDTTRFKLLELSGLLS